MIEGAALFYSLLVSFVLTSTQRNRKLNRPHAPMLVHAGHLLTGLSLGTATLLAIVAARHALI